MSQKTKGVLCILSSAFFFACMNTFVRLSGDLPSMQKSFFRNAVALAFALALVRRERLSLSVPKKHWLPLLCRVSFGTVGILCNYYAVDHLLLSDASMLNKLSPFFAILCSYFLLREKIRPYQAVCVLAAFIGSALIVKPGFVNTPWGPALIGVLGGLTAGIAYTFVRVLGTRGVKGPVIVFYFSAFSCAILLPYLLFFYKPMSPAQFVFLLLAGLSAAGGQFSITAAYTFAPAREISVYDYSQVIFSAVLGFFLFGQIPDAVSVLGYFIICGASVYMFLRRRHPGAS